MPDETRSNLEPIEESDLNLKEKFIAGTQPKKLSEIISENKMENPNLPEKDMERKEGKAETEEAYNKILSKTAAPMPAVDEDIANDAKEIVSREMDAESRINNLVGLAEAKGVVHAVSVAKHMQDNYILDEFHDRLADELHDALIKKGLIKEI
jgi:hypothetical protein